MLKDRTLLTACQLEKDGQNVANHQLSLFLGTDNKRLNHVLKQLTKRHLVVCHGTTISLTDAGLERVAGIRYRYQTWVSIEQQVPETGLLSGNLLQVFGKPAAHFW